MACCLTALVALLGPLLLAHWIGSPVGERSRLLLPTLAISFGLLALNVTGHYAMLAFGRVRMVTALNVPGGLARLLLMTILIPRKGVAGAALARLAYGPVTLCLYWPLLRSLRVSSHVTPAGARFDLEEV